ncbi:MAG: hypothetical protein U0T82_08130 [Bacteroidales bacterium]
MRRFLLYFCLITIVLLPAGYLVFTWYMPDYPLFMMFLPVLVVGAVTLASHLSLARLYQRDPKKFIRRFLVVTTLRIIGYSIFILGIIYLYRPLAKPFLIHFLLVYLVYLVFEVSELSSKRTD